jgi:hypothetical protein
LKTIAALLRKTADFRSFIAVLAQTYGHHVPHPRTRGTA